MKRVAIVACAGAMIGFGGFALAGAADAGPGPGSCDIKKAANGHSVSARCNLIGTYNTRFRVEGNFCGTSTCEWISGDIVPTEALSTASSGGYVGKVRIRYYLT